MEEPYRERLETVKQRLADALDPQGEHEHRVVARLGLLSLDTLEPLADMIERVHGRGDSQ